MGLCCQWKLLRNLKYRSVTQTLKWLGVWNDSWKILTEKTIYPLLLILQNPPISWLNLSKDKTKCSITTWTWTQRMLSSVVISVCCTFRLDSYGHQKSFYKSVWKNLQGQLICNVKFNIQLKWLCLRIDSEAACTLITISTNTAFSEFYFYGIATCTYESKQAQPRKDVLRFNCDQP